MPDERITARAFHAAEGLDDWRVLYWGACAHYRVASFTDGVAFIQAIGAVAEEVGHSPTSTSDPMA